MIEYPQHHRVQQVARCTLTVAMRGGSWAYALQNNTAICDAWREAIIANPHYFNGVVHLVSRLTVSHGVLKASLIATNFKSYLFWRKAGFPPVGVLDGFGSALIRARDGAILLGRQRSGNVNGGLSYLPGGFIDARDVGRDQTVDIAASILRELTEETGLTLDDVRVEPGFLVTEIGPHVSIAQIFVAPVDADALKLKIEQHIGADSASELDGVVVVRRVADMDALPMPDYARVLVRWLLDDGVKDA